MRIGIFMGGSSREREISFAGGRTVFDSLDRNIFTPIPIFVCPKRHFIALDWQYLYKGTIKDFFPPAFLPEPYTALSGLSWQEALQLPPNEYLLLLNAIGKQISIEAIASEIDFAFLTLHGAYGEDGTIQGLLEWYNIPYTGSGILGSCVGINKRLANRFMQNKLEHVAKQMPLRQDDIFNFVSNDNRQTIAYDYSLVDNKIRTQFQYPIVIKNPTQGSSIGVQVVHSEAELESAIPGCSFFTLLDVNYWKNATERQINEFYEQLTDDRVNLGCPIYALELFGPGQSTIYTVTDLQSLIQKFDSTAILYAHDYTPELIVEEFIDGIEFSVIVVQKGDEWVALPPTQIIKNKPLYDYRDKYLAGQAQKLTPIQAPDAIIKQICEKAIDMMSICNFDVYARIDGIVKFHSEDPENTSCQLFFNDPNTTSGMLPGSFFFHQAAEVGFTPKNFLTYIISESITSFYQRNKNPFHANHLLTEIHENIEHNDSPSKNTEKTKHKKVGVILGGYSSERHISVESGRNIYQKLSADGEFLPIPVFLLKNDWLTIEQKNRLNINLDDSFSFWEIPVNILLKDNADDIAKKISSDLDKKNEAGTSDFINQIRQQFKEIQNKYNIETDFIAKHIPTENLAQRIDFAFIGLHGRPGEDGTLQQLFETLKIPYSGSKPNVADLTMNKVACNTFLSQKGFKVPLHTTIKRIDWENNRSAEYQRVIDTIGFPMIAKPQDEGCSSAVKKINFAEVLIAYIETAFRNSVQLPPEHIQTLGLMPNEEFPIMEQIMIENFIGTIENEQIIEITVGFIEKVSPDGKNEIQIFTPSEAVSQGAILTLEEKFLAGEGQNITPARLFSDLNKNRKAEGFVKSEIYKAVLALDLHGYARIDAFLKIKADESLELIFIEVNSLPGMTPATCIFHQAAIAGYRPVEFIKQIIYTGLNMAYTSSF